MSYHGDRLSLDQALPENDVWHCWNLSEMLFFDYFKPICCFLFVRERFFEKCALPNIKKSHLPTTFVSIKVDESWIIQCFLCCLLHTSVAFCTLLLPSVHFGCLLYTSVAFHTLRAAFCTLRVAFALCSMFLTLGNHVRDHKQSLTLGERTKTFIIEFLLRKLAKTVLLPSIHFALPSVHFALPSLCFRGCFTLENLTLYY